MNCLFDTSLVFRQLGSMQGSLAIPFIMSGGLNGQQSDYLQYLLLKTESTCDAATNALKYMMITTVLASRLTKYN